MRFLLLLLLACYAHLSPALGLAELEVKSHLGEPLLAQLTVNDIPLNTDAGCFNASDLSDTATAPKIHVALQNNKANYQLSLSSTEIINEPILTVRLGFLCDPKLERDYTLLLDPRHYIEKASSEPSLMDTPPSLAHEPKHTPPATGKNSPVLKPIKPAPKNPDSLVQKDPRWAHSLAEKLQDAYTGKPEPENPSTAKATVQSKASTNKALLVISGASAYEASGSPSLALRLSKNIDLNRPAALASPSVTAASDDATAIDYRLAQLAKQMVSLQQRNQLLEAEAAKMQAAKTMLNWPTLALTSASCLAVLGLMLGLRRQTLLRQAPPAWFAAPATLPAEPDNPAPKSAPLAKLDFSLAPYPALSTELEAALSMEEITMPTANHAHTAAAEKRPVTEDLSWDFSKPTMPADKQ